MFVNALLDMFLEKVIAWSKLKSVSKLRKVPSNILLFLLLLDAISKLPLLIRLLECKHMRLFINRTQYIAQSNSCHL